MHLLRSIEKYIHRHNVAPTRFGRDAVGDPRFVLDLRRGREPGERVRKHVLAYMAEREAQA